jgi:hypothetical protein
MNLLLACLPFLFLLPNSEEDQNKLTNKEKKDGWQLLFDGSSTKGWHLFQKPGVMKPQWKVEEGTLTLTEKGGGDIVTDEEYENFEFQLEWKISEKGNSGVFFNVSEDTMHKTVWKTGPEMQILDDEGHPDGKFPTHRAGANYDLSVPTHPLTNKPGEWNKASIRVKDGHVTYTLNGKTTADYVLWSPEWEALVQKSKFKTMPGYGRMKKGHIALQDHSDKVWFRNIKIRKI